MANVKISQLSVASALTGSELIETVQGGTNKQTTTQAIANLGGGSSYLVYTALLTQSGTNAPVATILENTIPNVLTWVYFSVGEYRLTGDTDTFPVNKTVCFTQPDGLNVQIAFEANGDYVKLIVGDITNTLQNGFMENTAIEIRVYPA